MSRLCFSSLSSHADTAPKLEQFQARDGQTISYRAYESAKKNTAIVLLHGSSAHGEYLHPLAERLKSVGQVYVPNIRGHHGSGNVRGDCSYLGQLEDDFADLISHFSLRDKNIIVVGHSSGGGLAIRLAGGIYGQFINGFVLLSPAIPTAPTMREGTAGGWCKPSIWKIVLISLLNFFGIRGFNHANVIHFKRPPEQCDGTEILDYSFNLNTSMHPRLPYKKDIEALKGRSLVIIGAEDEANDPTQFPRVMQESASIQVIEGVKHLDIVQNDVVGDMIAAWIEKISKPTTPKRLIQIQ